MAAAPAGEPFRRPARARSSVDRAPPLARGQEEVLLARRAAGRTSRGSVPPPRGARACVPRSTMRPCSRTRIWSARRIVERRWAITNVVRPRMSQARPSWMRASDSESRLEVASSRIRIRGSARIARAIATRWRWPPERRTPRSPTTVSYPSAKALGELRRRARCGRPRATSAARRGGPRERDVLADRAVEEERLLQDDAEVGAVRVEARPSRGRLRPRGRGRTSARGTRRRGRSSWTCPRRRARRAR